MPDRTPPLKPLQQFVCDTCGGVIEEPADGMLQWRYGDRISGFTITHKPHRSPRRGSNGCYTVPEDVVNDFELEHVSLPTPKALGSPDYSPSFDALVRFTSLLEPRDNGRIPDVADIGEFMEVFRRLYVPYYEEARVYRKRAQADGMYEGLWGYQKHMQDILRDIIVKYGREDGEEL